MTKKEAIIKYITEMNTDMLSLILDDNKSYMDVSKEVFVNKLGEVFNNLKGFGYSKFSKVVNGHCGGDCNNGCEGYTFLTEDKRALDLIFEEEVNEIRDLYACSIFNNDEMIEDKSKISIHFYEDEKLNYQPTKKQLSLQGEIDNVLKEFKQFKNDVTDIDTFCKWTSEVKELYDNVDILDRMRSRFVEPLFNLSCKNSCIQKLVKLHPFATQAMKEFDEINVLNEGELIDWILKYEENELDYGDYVKVDNWEQNNLILHALDNSVVIDCFGYSESLIFSEVHPKHYWELFEKYKITEEQFEIAKEEFGVKAFDLRTFLKVRKL
ncbi:hypothetical protein [Psychroserpens jangbogonensis]|uniref:hypothetical protein n=1 Tax=Psychroserpens jangbogonensis TaxID=1484460 RepID=UPI00053D6C35|nr:hypothetical protein [Psychroserpens jangbogonensis]